MCEATPPWASLSLSAICSEEEQEEEKRRSRRGQRRARRTATAEESVMATAGGGVGWARRGDRNGNGNGTVSLARPLLSALDEEEQAIAQHTKSAAHAAACRVHDRFLFF
jgi:hypothetical protein